MTLRNPLYHPKIVFRLAMFCLLLFFAIGFLTRHAAGIWTDRIDGIRGMLLGMELGLMIWWLRLGGHMSCGESSSLSDK